eukprot:SM000002S05730  [mRNA]  locus=s2:1841316:1842185:- [translate_table: standard]
MASANGFQCKRSSSAGGAIVEGGRLRAGHAAPLTGLKWRSSMPSLRRLITTSLCWSLPEVPSTSCRPFAKPLSPKAQDFVTEAARSEAPRTPSKCPFEGKLLALEARNVGMFVVRAGWSQHAHQDAAELSRMSE